MSINIDNPNPLTWKVCMHCQICKKTKETQCKCGRKLNMCSGEIKFKDDDTTEKRSTTPRED